MRKQLTRLKQLVSNLQADPDLRINDLAKMFDVSQMTIRRDLALLAEIEVVEMSANGPRVKANFFGSIDSRYSLSTAETQNREEKMRIGERAVQLIETDDIVILDTGSTTELIARLLPEKLKCTVLCYNVNILVEVHKKANCNVIFTGGFYHDNTMMFESPEGVALIKRNRANKAFISATGINDRLGITCENEYELDTRQAIIQSSMTRILVADSSKFDKVRSTHFASLEDIDVLVTDEGIPDKYRQLVPQLGIDLYIV